MLPLFGHSLQEIRKYVKIVQLAQKLNPPVRTQRGALRGLLFLADATEAEYHVKGIKIYVFLNTEAP
jgi:hypothetical protein